MQLLALLRLGDEIDWVAAAGWFYLLFLLSIGVVGVFGLLRQGAPQWVVVVGVDVEAAIAVFVGMAAHAGWR